MTSSLGIDIGTTFITTFDSLNNKIDRIRHKGRLIQSLQQLFEGLNSNTSCSFTGKSGKDISTHLQGIYIEEAVSLSYLLSSSNNDWFQDKKGQIVDIGASSLTLYTINQNRVIDIRENTLCAAGTGLFLEEQAERLNIHLESQAELSIQEPPLIASRCTVFAKSDLIHHQQEGRSKTQMWSGLCRSLVISAVNTLFRGEEPHGKIIICGGVSLNKEVIRWFKQLYKEAEWLTPFGSHALIAAGASLNGGKSINRDLLKSIPHSKPINRMPPLLLQKSVFPTMNEPSIDDQENEIRFHQHLHHFNQFLIGIDIGSTSTKLALLDSKTLEPVIDIYRKTEGDPVEATRKLFTSLYKIAGDHELKINAFATTGSGRKLVGQIFGADTIVNEITAHGKGAAFFFPQVQTIFEIGGQDAKFINLRNGYISDVNMNYVCAAGTGSFVEEQARKLGFKIHEVGEITQAVAPPVTSDRCTVFMEQDLRMLLKNGFTKEEAMASVLYSVIKNYLNRVVGNRPINKDKIMFQGATARNKGLVAAIENLLQVQVIVSPFCHLMGAIGAALIANENMKKNFSGQNHSINQSRFIKKDAQTIQVTSRTQICKLCSNFCRINYISRKSPSSVENEFSWGYQCGRDPQEHKRREIPQYRLFKEREKIFYSQEAKTITAPQKGTITLIHTLSNYTFHPLWVRFFSKLGYQVNFTHSTDSKIKKYSSRIASADFCFPAKVALGHMLKALEYPHHHFIFTPYMIADKNILPTAHSFFCPYVESSPSVLRSTLSRNRIPLPNFLSPVIDFRQSLKEIALNLYNDLSSSLSINKNEVMDAFQDSYSYWQEITQKIEEKGSQLLREKINTREPVFLLLGRPYNLHDRGLNLGIPEKIASMGYTVIPLDMLELDVPQLAQTNYHNIFWKYGQRIIAAIHLARQYDNLFPIFFSNFNCGPDSFLLTYTEEENNGKPMLILELDEHDSDGGYLTRIQAFIDVVQSYIKQKAVLPGNSIPNIYTVSRKPNLNGTIWVPPLHQTLYRMFAAAIRGFGYNSRTLELEDREALELGKKYLRGGECLPMTLTLGKFLDQIQKEKTPGHHILFMPTTEGPCRFGQYTLLNRIVFHRLQLKNVDILSPSSINSYQGLPEKLRRLLMHAVMASDIVFKMAAKTRPYERSKGDTNQLLEKCTQKVESILEKKENPIKSIKEFASLFSKIPIFNDKKPLVGLVGEIYVRANAFANGGLIDIIEENGAEAWLSPMHEWFLYVPYMERIIIKKFRESMLKKFASLAKNVYIFRLEHSYYKEAQQILHDRREPPIDDVVQAGAEYLPIEFDGESILTIGRAVLFAKQAADMVINIAPFGCMPGTLSSSILLEIKEKFNIPFLSMFYDGDLDINHKVAALLKTIKNSRN